MAGAIGSPVARSQTTVVSRWLVIPMATMSLAVKPALAKTSRATASWLRQISLASCSTHPGCGKCWANSCCAVPRTMPWRSNSSARELVVPWSRARMNVMSNSVRRQEACGLELVQVRGAYVACFNEAENSFVLLDGHWFALVEICPLRPIWYLTTL